MVGPSSKFSTTRTARDLRELALAPTQASQARQIGVLVKLTSRWREPSGFPVAQAHRVLEVSFSIDT
jgi:hypothetical protein